MKGQEAGLPTTEVCRKHGLSTPTFYNLKVKYGSLEVSGARRLRQFEDENGQIKRRLADSLIDAHQKLAIWRYDYNNVRPLLSLGNRRPAQARRG